MADDLYGILGVAKDADAAAIKSSYRKLAKDLHPDKNPGNKKAEDRFKTVNHAFDVLSDPKKRGLYDEFGEEGLRDGFDAERVRTYNRWAKQQGAGGASRGGGGWRAYRGSLRQSAVQRRDRRPLRRPLWPQRPAPARPNARRRPRERRLHRLRLRRAWRDPRAPAAERGPPPSPSAFPQGASDGSRVRIAGTRRAVLERRAGRATSSSPFTSSRTPSIRREGDDLHLDLPVAIAEAYQGAKVKVETFAGPVTLKVAPGTQSGTAVRLRGKGVTRKGNTGDLYVHFMVRVPAATKTPEI
jgi:curved DNA-binding protein